MTREETIIAHLAPLAREAGMVLDPDAMKLLDLSSITVSEKGEVIVPKYYFVEERRKHRCIFQPDPKKGGYDGKNVRSLGYEKQDQAIYDAEKRAYVRSVGKR